MLMHVANATPVAKWPAPVPDPHRTPSSQLLTALFGVGLTWELAQLNTMPVQGDR